MTSSGATRSTVWCFKCIKNRFWLLGSLRCSPDPSQIGPLPFLTPRRSVSVQRPMAYPISPGSWGASRNTANHLGPNQISSASNEICHPLYATYTLTMLQDGVMRLLCQLLQWLVGRHWQSPSYSECKQVLWERRLKIAPILSACCPLLKLQGTSESKPFSVLSGS